MAEESWTDEPGCLGYCWLVSAVPAELRVCGFELYSNPAALTEVHRAGTAYRRFKTALMQEELAPPPTRDDLRFWCPLQDPSPELNKSPGEDTPLTFLVSRYQLDSPERREALLKDLESEHREAQSTTSATRIVATAPDSYDVVMVHIAHSTALDDLYCKKIEEQLRYVTRMLPLSAGSLLMRSHRMRDMGVPEICHLWQTSTVSFLRGNSARES